VDPSLVLALALGVLGVLAWKQFKPKEKAPRCPNCKLEMERDAAMLDPDDPATRHPLAGGMLAEQLLPQLILYHCPRCGRRTRIRR
jgi:hypothetical protein